MRVLGLRLRLNLRTSILSSRRGTISSVPFFLLSSQSQFRLSRLLEILGKKVKPNPKTQSQLNPAGIGDTIVHASSVVITRAKDLLVATVVVLGIR